MSRPGVTGNKVEHRRWELAAEAATAAAERKRLSLLLAIEFTGAAVLLKRGGRWISTSGVRTRGGGSGGKAIPAASPGTTFFRLYRPETAAQCCNVLSPGCWSTSAAERDDTRGCDWLVKKRMFCKRCVVTCCELFSDLIILQKSGICK